jgi:hypothetical protein
VLDPRYGSDRPRGHADHIRTQKDQILLSNLRGVNLAVLSLAAEFPGGASYSSELLFRADLGEPLRMGCYRSDGAAVHRFEDLIEYALSFAVGQPPLALVAAGRWLSGLLGRLGVRPSALMPLK